MKKYERIVEKLEATLKYNTTDGSDVSYNTTMMAVTAMVVGRQQGASEHHFLWGEYLRRLLGAAQLHSGSQSRSLLSFLASRRPVASIFVSDFNGAGGGCCCSWWFRGK